MNLFIENDSFFNILIHNDTNMSTLYIILIVLFVLLMCYIFYPRSKTCHLHEHGAKEVSRKEETKEVLREETEESQEEKEKESVEEKEKESVEESLEKEQGVHTEESLEEEQGEKDFEKKIPKLIWTYWDSEQLPPIIEKFRYQWQKHCPDYTITVLSPSNLGEYIKENVLSLPMSTTPQRTSDFVRLHVLAEHGGVWLDASLLLTTSLDWIHEFHTDVVVYSIDHITTTTKYPVLENWFIACVAHCDFIEKWKKEFMSINSFDTPESYLANVEERGVNLSSIFCTPYLSMHVAAQYVLQQQTTSSTMTVLDARDGPYRHLRFNSVPLSFEQGIGNLCNDEIQPVVKFRGIDREYMNAHEEECNCIQERFFAK